MNAGERKAGYPNSQGHAQLPAGYGLTHAQLESLRKLQTRGEVKLVPAVGEDNDYEVPEHDFLYVYHVETQNPVYSRTTGQREDRGAVVQQYNVAAFKHMEKNGGFRGMEVVILHNPELAQQYVAQKNAEDNATQGDGNAYAAQPDEDNQKEDRKL